MRVDAARAAEIALASVEAGSGVATLLTVSGAGAGDRLVVVVSPDGSETVYGTLGSSRADEAGARLARASMDDPRHRDGIRELPGEIEVYVEVRRPVPDLVIVGAGHIARPMCRIGADLGFRVWVLDDRPDFATRERFPDAHAVVRGDFDDPFRDIPIHERTHVLLVTRGHKYDYDCLVRILRADPKPAYIGMIGSRRRVRATFVQLIEEGFPRERLHAVHAPVGLDVGAETPEEIAVAVAAELVLVRRGGTGTPLRDKERVAERFFGEKEEG